MFFNLILVFCIVQNAQPVPYKNNKEVESRHLDRYGVDFNRNNLNERIFKTLYKDDSSELSSESRRLFDWLKRVLYKNETKVTTQKTPLCDPVINEEIKFRQIEKNLTETLTKLSHVLNQILNIVKYSRSTYFDDIREFLPTKFASNKVNRRDKRYKRDSDKVLGVSSKKNQANTINKGVINLKSYQNQTKMDLDKSDNVIRKNIESKNVTNKIDTKNNVPTLESQGKINDVPKKRIDKDLLKAEIATQNYKKILVLNNSSDAVTENDKKIGSLSLNIQEKRIKRDTAEVRKEVAKVNKKIEVTNKNSSGKVEVKDTKTGDLTINGRRNMPSIKVTNDEVKNRLFHYIDEAFSDIMKKIESLKETKEMFSKDISYQVGYIISNIDTLEVTMKNMKRDMDKNKYIWDDEKILNLFDTVKVSNQAVVDLLEILKSYIEKSIIN